MHVLFVSPEVWPLARVGGLAEVSHDLPLALAARGHTVDVVTPRSRLTPDVEARLTPLDISLEVPVSWRRHHATLSRLEIGQGVNVYLVGHENLFDREGLYGNAYGDYEDNAERFIFFSRAAMELALALGRKVDLVHANDWTTGLVPLYLKAMYHQHPLTAEAGSLMTVHNLGSQGVFWHYDMPLTGLGWEYFTPEAIEFYGKINFLKAGLVFADMISTVSPTYAREIQAKDMGYGLEGVIATRRDRLAAVINGVDYQTWAPRSDKLIAANYGPDDLAGKQVCRAELRRAFGLDPDTAKPLLGFLGRLVDRRGLDILAPALESVLDLGLDVVIMGFGDDHYHAFLQDLRRRRPESVGLAIGYEMEMAHRLTAGADMLLMPSLYEPCGLHQLHAMRYGTVPVVRATGGLDDTVSDHRTSQPGVGFKFGPYQAPAMLEALGRALEAYSRPAEWQGLMRRAMALDFSWQRAAAEYEAIYVQARQNRLAQKGA